MITLFLILQTTFAQIPRISEPWQLQQLINKSEQQIQSLKEILNYSKQDAIMMEKASKVLERLTVGIDQSIKMYQGTETYDKALLALQAMDDFGNTYLDTVGVRELAPKKVKELQDNKSFDNFINFQKESVKGNIEALKEQKELEKALLSAGPGFTSKIQAQADLGHWQSNIRVSAQITELLAAVHAMREELRLLRLKQTSSSGIDILLQGAEMQNLKNRKKESE